MSQYFEPEIETASRATLTALQERKLRAQVRYAYDASPFYRKKLDEAGVGPDAIERLDDLCRFRSPPRTS